MMLGGRVVEKKTMWTSSPPFPSLPSPSLPLSSPPPLLPSPSQVLVQKLQGFMPTQVQEKKFSGCSLEN